MAAAATVLVSSLGAGPASANGPAGSARVGDLTPVTPQNHIVGPANNSPVLVADPTNGQFVVLANRLDGPDYSCALSISSDGGLLWRPVNPVPVLPTGAQKCYAPEIAFDAAGVLYFLFVGLAGNGNHPMGVFLTTSNDRGRSFSVPHQIMGANKFAVRMAIDPSHGRKGRLHLVWIEATSDPGLGAFGPPPNPIMASYSDDGGLRFSPPVQVSDPGRQRVVAPAVTLGPHGSVHVAYYDLGRDAVDYQGLAGPVWDGTWTVVVSTSADRGEHFDPGVAVDNGVVPGERVMLIFTMPAPSVVAGPGSRVCAAWTDARLGNEDAVLRCSPDDGRTWSPLRRLNDDPPGNGRSHYLPRLAVAPGGRLDAIFYDRRRDADNKANDVYYTFSTDSGTRFAPNVRLTEDNFSSEIGQRYAGPAADKLVEFGSRLALLSRPTRAVAAWTDTHDTIQGISQDIFATRIDIGGPDGFWHADRGWIVLAVGVIGSLALILFARARRRRPGKLAGP